MFNCWADEIRDYFGVNVDDETVKVIRDKIEATMLNSLRPKMTWVQRKEDTPYSLISQYYCSNCGNDELVKTPFCPQCGAMYAKDLK